jgi:hypothetical protein
MQPPPTGLTPQTLPVGAMARAMASKVVSVAMVGAPEIDR